MNLPDAQIPQDGFFVTHFLTVKDQAKSKAFYVGVLGGKVRHSVEIRQPIKKAQARLAELRAQGISPGHGGQAARKRGAKITESNRKRSYQISRG